MSTDGATGRPGSALVAGGTSGLGLATARALLARGHEVVLLARGRETGERALKELGPGAHLVTGSVTDPDAVASALDRAEEAAPLRIGVNCAGLGRSGTTLSARGPHPLAEFAETVEVNLTGAFNVARLAAERMARNAPADGERGVLVQTASAAAYEGQRGQAAYAASKAGLIGMTLPMARDLGRYGIRVVTLAPGMFETPMLDVLPDPARDAIRAELPHTDAFGDPAHFAALVLHVLDNPMLNGATLRVDGGLRLPSGLRPRPAPVPE
ncbi:SDR family NAD(P)-dependent oxidoreductase [Streptomyces sp. BBFR2]|uniref:SDR family NAD(P)-dependent oxidoreductase n=1 Tax=Streptomyces sp. BBFR2 TaxID=3372854 RepID=UPI0037DA4B4E